MTLAWSQSADTNVVGYFRYYGRASGNYTNKVNVGKVTSATIPGLTEGATYFFAITAYVASGLESVPSNEVGYTAPLSNNPPIIVLTSPVNGAGYTAPATINLAASVTANGHSITKVQFYNGATLLGEDTSAPYTLTWSNVASASYVLTARVLYDAGNMRISPPANITVTGLPAPWQTADIGRVGAVGSATLSNGLYVVKGAGTIGGTADSFRFVYQPLSGDGEIRARLNSVQNIGTAGRVGVIIRESLTSASECAFMGISPDGQIRWQRRGKTGGSTASTTSSTGIPPNVWARLVRSGNTISGYKSTDGTTWALVNSRSITMATNIYFGLAVASGSSNTLNTATFSSLTVAP